MADSIPSYGGFPVPVLRVVENSELKLEADTEAGEAFERVDYGAVDEASFRAMMACFSPMSATQMEQWVQLYRQFVAVCPGSPFYFNAPFYGEGEFRIFELVDDTPPTAAHPARFQLLWDDCRGECVGNGQIMLMVHSDDAIEPVGLVFGTWADSVPTWSASNETFEPLIKAVRLALKNANLEFGFDDAI